MYDKFDIFCDDKIVIKFDFYTKESDKSILEINICVFNRNKISIYA